MEKRIIQESELLLTAEGKIYHLNLSPDDIGNIIFLVGDPGRVKLMSSFFDEVDTQVENREFVTHSGTYNSKRVSVVSTGIGTDNIDIVINELDALANIDLKERKIKDKHKKLQFVRIGTSGALHADIDPGSIIVTAIAGGLDNLLHYYADMNQVNDTGIGEAFVDHMQWNNNNSTPYFVHASRELLSRFENKDIFKGITLSAPGFYAPQGRSLRLDIHDPEYVEKVSSFRYHDIRINNFEMEGSALYGLAALLGHNALTVCIALANRISKKTGIDYKPFMKRTLKYVLETVTRND